MKLLKDLWNKGLAVIPAEVRGAKVDQFDYVSKRTGKQMHVDLVRISLEVEVGGSYESFEGSVNDIKVVPLWAVRGNKVFLGCSEVKRENRRMAVRIVEAIPVKDIKE